MSGYVGPPDGIGASPLDVTPLPNPLQQYYDQLGALHGVLTPNAPAPNPVGTSAVQTMGMPAAGYDTVVGTRGDGTPIMQSEIDAIHAQRAAGANLALTTTLGMTGSIADAAQGDLFAQAAAAPKPNPLMVYHGTPHLFAPTETNPLGAFELGAIGTGEGAQVYGHGLYVAENPETASYYRNSVQGDSMFDFSASGGPERVDSDTAGDHLREQMLGDPDLEHLDDRMLTNVSDWVTTQYSAGYGPSKVLARAEAQRARGDRVFNTPGAMDAVAAAVDHMAGVKVDVSGPSVGGELFTTGDPTHEAALAVHQAGGDTDAAIDALDTKIARLQPQGDLADADMARYAQHVQPQIDQLEEQRSRIVDSTLGGEPLPAYKPPGHQYEVELHGQPEEFLDWDKPYSQQSPAVQAGLMKVGVGPPEPPRLEWQEQPNGSHVLMENGRPGNIGLRPMGVPGQYYQTVAGRVTGSVPASQLDAWKAERLDTRASNLAKSQPDLTGQDLYRSLSSKAAGRDVNPSHWAADYLGDPAAASQALSDAGVKGIRYLDAGSRSATGKQTSNYVVFNPAIMNIVRRYGIGAILPAGAGAGALAGAQSRQ